MSTPFRIVWRSLILCLYFASGLTQIIYLRLRRGPSWFLLPESIRFIQLWMQRVARLLGLRIEQHNRPANGACLFVANHISFLDIVVVAAIIPVRYLSKHTVAYWPVIGTLTAMSGTVFIERGKRSLIHRTVDALDKALRQSRPILMFPEGTTGLGHEVRKFHTGLFQAAIDSQVSIQAIALQYRRDNAPDRTAAYIDKDNFVIKLLSIMAKPATSVQVSFCTPISPTDRNRQTLASLTHQQIEHALQLTSA